MSPVAQYWVAVGACLAVGAAGCLAARRSARVARIVGRCIALVLIADAVVFATRPAFTGHWTARGSLPLSLCDVALAVAVVTCWVPRWRLGVELTYFWGAAGTLQAVATPDLTATFPSLEFDMFVVGHVGILVAVGYLIGGLRLVPRRGSALRVYAITVGYAAVVGVLDWLSGANYMYLARRPAQSSLLSVLGPWPWYVLSAAVIGALLFALLDAPFRRRRSTASPQSPKDNLSAAVKLA